jgi:hypothetical protein
VAHVGIVADRHLDPILAQSPPTGHDHGDLRRHLWLEVRVLALLLSDGLIRGDNLALHYRSETATAADTPRLMIALTYQSVDGHSRKAVFKTKAGAARFARKWVGTAPDIGTSYAVSADGVGTLRAVGIALEDLFPMTDRTIKRDRRDAARRKRRPVHGRGLVHIVNAVAARAKRVPA